jgi:hypothetical protein
MLRGVLGVAALVVVGGVVLDLGLVRSVHAAPTTDTVTDWSSANATVSGSSLNLDTSQSGRQLTAAQGELRD